MTLTVREATAADRPAVVAFMAALNRYENRFESDRDESLEAADSHIAHLEDLIETQGGFTLVAELDGVPVGFLLGLILEAEGTFIVPDERRYGDISDLFVDSNARGKGVARAMLTEAEAQFRSRGIERLRVTALTANDPATATYRADGFTPLYTTFRKELGKAD